MFRDVIKMGHPKLMHPAQAVSDDEIGTESLNTLIDELVSCLHHYKGVGLAANQIGIDKRIVVIGFDKNLRYPNEPSIPLTIMINPCITPLTNTEIDGWEGCLSVPGLRGVVPRYQSIRCSYRNLQGEPMAIDAENFMARVIQHECDHLDGICFPMRMRDMNQFGFEDSLPEFSNASQV